MSGFPGNFDTGLPADDVMGIIGNVRDVSWQADLGNSISASGGGFQPVGTAVAPIGYGVGTPNYYSDFTDTRQVYRGVLTSAANNDNAGWIWPSSTAGLAVGFIRQWKPLVTIVVKTLSTNTFQRIACGIYSDTTATTTGAADPAVSGAGFRFDTAVDTGTGCSGGSALCWRTWSNDGVSTGAVTTPSHAAALLTATTTYVLQMDLSSSDHIDYFINGTKVATHTTSSPTGGIPATGTVMGWACGVQVLAGAGAARGLTLAGVFVKFPF
jgi:hypothetical protein